jgi:hypothetical protein
MSTENNLAKKKRSQKIAFGILQPQVMIVALHL